MTSRFLRRAVEWLVVLAITALLLDTFLVDGWLAPYVVASGSMAPALLGPHRVARCAACGMEFSCDADNASDAAVICLNCGWPDNRLDPRTVAGDRLLLDRATLGWPGVRRWDVAVFRNPENARDFRVKRVVGLPGESVEIRDGDVCINGQIARKTLAQQRAMAVAVDDMRWRDPKMPSRWQAEPPGSWAQADGGFRRARPASAGATGGERPIDWLTYVHWQRAAGSPGVARETPVRDDDAYNLGTSRQLNDVTDLMLVARLTASGGGELLLRAHDGRSMFQFSIHPETGAILLQRDGRQIASAHAAKPFANRSVEIVVSTFDRQVLLAVDGRVELTHAYEPAAGPLRAISRPLAIGAGSLEVDIQRLAVFRDVYYTPPTHAVARPARQLGPDEFFVLGDNSPISVDSREWMGGETVGASLLIGRPLLRRP